MSMEKLYTELGVDFQPNDRQMYLQEFSDVARDVKSSLGPAGEAEVRSNRLQELAAELGKEAVDFSPHLVPIALDEKLFGDLSLKVSPYIASLLERYKFYLVHFPITVVPRPGGGFVQLECIVEFNPDAPPAERPIAYQIFPQEEWQTIIQASQELKIGLDENFEFKVDPLQALAKIPELEPPVKAAVESKIAGKAGLIVGPFDYGIRRPKIISKGQGNVKVRWRMDSEQNITQEEPRLGVVLQVPNHVTGVDVNGVLIAYPTFHFFTAEVRHLLQFLSTATSNFFKKGAPLTNEMQWRDITGGI